MSLYAKITATGNDIQRMNGHSFSQTLTLWLSGVIDEVAMFSRLAHYYPTIVFGTEEQDEILEMEAHQDGLSTELEKINYRSIIDASVEDANSGFITEVQWKNRTGIS